MTDASSKSDSIDLAISALENSDQFKNFPINSTAFKSFLDETFGAKEILQISYKYTDDTESLIDMISNFQSKLTNNKSVKSRSTNLKKTPIAKRNFSRF